MSQSIQIRQMMQSDIETIYTGLALHDVSKPLKYIERCWEENQTQARVTHLVFYENDFAGWGHVVFKSHYPHFAENNIPEIQNFDIIPPFRKRGIGSALIEVLEEEAFSRSNSIGIGFGLYASYGTAQRLYVKRGYIPDGRGVMYNDLPVEPGSQVCIDDELVLYLIKSK